MKPQQQPQQKQDTSLIEAEIEHNIPVKQHISDELKNPIAAIKQFVEHDKKDDKELDKVLKDVNESVKGGNDKSARIDKSKKDKPHSPKPVLAIVAAILVATGLGIAAFSAFSSPATDQKSDKIKTSVQSSQSSGSETTDLSEPDKLSKDLKEELDGLNDSQEFNTSDLSDQNLGL